MALDVRLSRDVDEPWGFEIFGGADEEMPLTIEKIEPDSPAKRAGLLNGDTILTINGEEAIDMSLRVASRRVEEAGHGITIGVLRGLYDPVLDDTEPLCYDYLPDDLDPQSEPTEVVFQVQQFLDPNDLGSHAITPATLETPANLSESRSLTASPFVTPTKPYRPFSTEPIVEVPTLEDPIILNPNYRDEFGKTPLGNDPDYLLTAFGGDGTAGRFKLPISDQYDPDGTRFTQNTEVVEKLLKYERHVKSLSKDLEVVDVTKETIVCEAVSESTSKDAEKSVAEEVKIEKKELRISEDVSKHEEIKTESLSVEKKEMLREASEEQSIKEELQYIEKMRQEKDLETIEKTAISVVDDSIERAVSVTEEIKKEIDVELSSTAVEQKSEVVSKSELKDVSETVKSEHLHDSSEIIDKQSTEYVDRKMSREERVEHYEDASQKIARKEFKESETVKSISKKEGADIHRKSIISEEYKHEEIREEPRVESTTQEAFENKGKFKKVAKSVATSVKSDKTAEQRAYTIGLQTIPNIRGTAHSSYHYDLLLRTFFIHLTDVMVALSRFLLSQPVFNQIEQSTETSRYESGESDIKVKKSSQEVIEKTQKVQEAKIKVESKQDGRQLVTPVPIVEKKEEVKSVSQKIETDMKVESVKVQKKEVVKPVAVKEVKEELKVEKLETKDEQKIEKVTGSQMAQRTEKKLTQEITQKMDAVISEFQTIAVEEDTKKEMLMKNRRSRSRSQIEEEVMKEGDPLDWLEKVDSRRTSQEKTEVSKMEFSSSEKNESKSFVEMKQESHTHKKSKTPKQTYVAIVEAHVYTNKDAIFEEHVTDISETSSVQSAEEINTAVEAIETISTENVAIETALKELETAKIVEETHKLETVTAESAATVQTYEEMSQETKEIIHEEIKKESALLSTDIQEVIIQETKEIIEPVVEIKQKSIEVENVAIDINESLSIAELTEVRIEESKTELTSVEMKEEVAIVQEEKIEEKVIETKAEVVEPKPIEIVEISETIKIKPKEDKKSHDEFAALKIVKTVEIDANLSPEIIEVEDISELISKSAVSKLAIGNQVSIDASKEVSEISSLKTEIDKIQTEQNSSTDISQSTTAEIDLTKSEMKKESTADITKSSQISSSKTESLISTQLTEFTASAATQESSYTVKSDTKKLSLKTDLERQTSIQSPPSTIDTPTPGTVPPTPLTDEYVFKLSLPLPKSRSATPVPRNSTLSPDDEDPHIVKKHLIPHIETTIESVIYDPPLPTPTESPKSPVFTKPVLNGGGRPGMVYCKPGLKGGAGRVKWPVYRKPGLFGGGDNPEYSKEEIREIERKSSLLASAIDETIKSIEEYKEEVGIDSKKEVKVQEFKEEKISKSHRETHTTKIVTETTQNGFEEIDTKIEEIMQQCNALASINTTENGSKIDESESKGIVTEFEDSSFRKHSIDIENNIEQELKTKDKSVHFENGVKIVEFVEETTPTEKVEIIPKKIAKEVTIEQTQVIEMKPEKIPSEPIVEPKEVIVVKPAEEIAVQEDIIPEKPAEIQPEPVIAEKVEVEEKSDPLSRVRPVVFDPESIPKRSQPYFTIQEPTGTQEPRQSPYMTESGEIIGTIQGIVDGLEESVIDEELAKALGKPGISEEKIASLISGEAEMLREAHVMGLSRVLKSHMHRPDDSSVDFQKIKPLLGSLKDSEVLKALNEELERQRIEEKKKEEKKWTTFLQKPKRPVPKAKFGYHGWTGDEEVMAEPYKVKIVKQAKPRVAPDYKPEDFETGPLPWEQRAETEASLPPVEPEDPILIPEVPEFLEAVDPLKESEVPDLEDTGIPLPPPKIPTPPPTVEEQPPEPSPIPEEEVTEATLVETEAEEKKEEVMENRLAEQLVRSVQSMVDPNATLDQQLAQMRAQIAALAQLPEVIQQSLELVSKQLSKMSHQETHVEVTQEMQNYQQMEAIQNHEMETIQEVNEVNVESAQTEAKQTEVAQNDVAQTEAQKVMTEVEDKMEAGQQVQAQEPMRMTPVITEEEMRREKQKKEQARIEHESRIVKQHPTPRASKPKRVFGPPDPDQTLAIVLPGGRRWRQTQDVYDEQMIKDMFEKQSEVIKGNAIGESAHKSHLIDNWNQIWPWGDTKSYCRKYSINFMKYQKPPVSLDHLKHSEVYKLIHDEETMPPPRKVEMRTPVICEADYRERCRSMTPSVEKKHQQIPQQFHP